jgi:ATP-binding cassette subfamily B protein
VTASCAELSWPASRLGEALAALGQRSALAVERAETAVPSPKVIAEGGEQLGRWIEATAGWLGLEAEPVQAHYPDVEQLICRVGPALLRLPGESEPRFLVLLKGDSRQVSLLTPDLARVRLAPEVVRAALCRGVEARFQGTVEPLLDGLGLVSRRRERARRDLLRELMVAERMTDCWLLRPSGNAGLATLAREGHLPRLLLTLSVAHLCEYSLWILSWWLLGWMTLSGHLDPGWLLAWLLLLLTLVPFRLLTTMAGGRFSIGAGAVLKRRLLFGALRLEPDEIRHQGAGQLLGRILESEAIEQLALTGGFLGLTALIELVLSAIVLGAGAGSGWHVALLLGLGLVVYWLAVRFYRRRRQWTEVRLRMTNDLVERMIGHRTRLAQEAPAEWHAGEDEALEEYVREAREFDRAGVALVALVPRAWLIVGLLGLAPAFLTGSHSSASIAAAIGGIVLAYRAFGNLVNGLEKIAGVAIAWGQIKPYWEAAVRREPLGHPSFAVAPATMRSPEGRALLDAHDLVFRYRDRGEPVLQGAGVRIRAGDRLLLEGPSGGGKSTLAALLAGSRVPQSGLLLLDGLDRATLGTEGWRRRVVIAPQFHENHVLMGTLAFNILMGRGWPPRPADLDEAEKVCRALDLGPLLERMPAGLQQIVGETGWQLSHGEKSRLYIARAILQEASLLILDESFAALDPLTLQRTLRFVLEKATTVVVIAHP